jgi:hypothetical protein
MKKLVLVSTMIVSLAGMSAFGQGWMSFSLGKSAVYDGFTTPGVSGLGATVDTALMWAPVGTPTPVVSALLASTPTTGNSSTSEGYTVATAWSDILTDPNFTLAYNYNGGAPVLVTGTTVANGGVANQAYPLSNASGSEQAVINTFYNVFVISWNAAYATPALAEANNSAVGWSSVFSYEAYAFTSTANALTPPQHIGTFVPIPEPATIALAGLGSLSLLLFRRRK